MKTKSDAKLLSGINVLLKHRISIALKSVDFFELHENRHPVKALVHLRKCFYHLSRAVISNNLNDRFDHLDIAFGYAEEATLQPWRLQFNRKMKKILARTKSMKYLGTMLGLRKVSLRDIGKSLAIAEEYKVSAEKNHKRLKDKVNDYRKAYHILHNIEKEIPGRADYFERIFQILLMLAGIFVGILVHKYFF